MVSSEKNYCKLGSRLAIMYYFLSKFWQNTPTSTGGEINADLFH